MKHLYILATATMLALPGCAHTKKVTTETTATTATVSNPAIAALHDTLRDIASQYPGEIGIALITDQGDTITVNNENKYPLMSVFKLHQAMALCKEFEKRGTSPDTTVILRRAALNPDTWSPMLKDYPDNEIKITVRELLRYTLTQSDNNASNWLFEHIQPVAATDSCIAALLPRDSFQLKWTEAQMDADHRRCYENCSTPLGAAMLINLLYTDSPLNADNTRFLSETLRQCHTGTDRIVAPLLDKPGVTAGHKTGSGFRDNGILAAHNDVAYVTLPDGRSYALAVLVKDYRGTEQEAARAIARISEAVYGVISSYKNTSTAERP